MLPIAHILLAALMVMAPPAAARAGASPEEGPKRVLIVYTYGPYFQPFTTLTNTFRTELAARFPEPVEFKDISLESAHFDEGMIDQPVAEYIRALSAREKPDLVVAAGAPAFNFCQQHAQDALKDMALLGAGIERRHTEGRVFGSNTAVVNNDVDLVGMVQGILELLPDTRHVYVVMGSSPLERFWAERARSEWVTFGDRVGFVWLENLTLQQIQEQTASLPPQSAILFALMKVDAAHVPYERNIALDTVRATASAPIFGIFAPDVGHGTVGGRATDVVALGVESAKVAARILGGASPGSIAATTVGPSVPTYDARELKRWSIPESRLPAGAVVLYRTPTLWSAYRVQIMAVVAILLIQTLLIALYLGNRLRLRTARAELAQRALAEQELRGELRHAGRVSLLGQFTAALAHELGQPLGAILRNVEAAELFLKQRPADLDEINAIVQDVRSDAARAGDVIARLRGMLTRDAADVQVLSWPDVAREVVYIVQPEARARGIALDIETTGGLPAVRGDRVQVQQVLLNLIANGMDASAGAPDPRVTVRLRPDGNGCVECAVSDNGTGIEADRLEAIFEPFTTSKEHGMGMGLPISRTIVDAHGGRLWAERNAGRGATFRFTLPAERGADVHD